MEPWIQLQSHRAGRQKTRDSVETVRKAWAQTHETKTDENADRARYEGTYNDVVEVLRSRYKDPTKDEWFAGNDDFLEDLDRLFTKLQAREADLAEIEAHITKEKEKWYRLSLHASPLRGLAAKSIGRPALASILDDGDKSWDGVTRAVRGALPRADDAAPTADDVLAKLEGLDPEKDREKRGEVLAALFLGDPTKGSGDGNGDDHGIPASCMPAAEALRRGAALEKVMAELEATRAGTAGRKSAAETHRRKLAELRRAQAAHLQAKSLKAQKRERKQKAPQVEDAVYESVPEGVSLGDVRACALCQVFAGLGVGKGRKVYEAMGDCEAQHEEHVRMDHSCAAGRECVQLSDEDVDMLGNEDSGVVICQECAEDLDRATTYCSERCARGDFQRHREDVHIPGRRKLGKREVEVDTKDVVFEDEDRTKYHVEDISNQRPENQPAGSVVIDFTSVSSSSTMDSGLGAGIPTTASSNGSHNGTTTASSGTVAPKPRVSSACEACRLAKVKCQPSDRSGVCRRNHATSRRPPPPGPSKTFSINFDMPAPDSACPAALESLAHRHASYIDSLLPPDDPYMHTPMFDDLLLNAFHSFHHPGGFALTPPRSHTPSTLASDHPTFNQDSPYHPHSHSSSSVASSSSLSGDVSAATTGSSPGSSGIAHPTVSISSIGLKPQFNLDSASHLLDCFRQMLPHFPCIVLPPDATVQSLAKSRPFVLLAILSVASGAGSLQGHTLYDDEFRKILALKFVAGGERSVELLQGLLIYSAWYPFHLRPKNKQAFQYVRMAAEIAHDLNLVEPPTAFFLTPDSPVTPEQIDGMRTYLSCYYLVSSFIATWARFSALGLEYTQWTATCCDVLERRSDVEGDRTLSWLVRCSHIIEETSKVDRPGPDADDKNTRFMLLGLESQFREWRGRIPSTSIPNGSALQIATAFTELYLYATPLLRLGKPPAAQSPSNGAPLDVDPDRLAHVLPILRHLFDTFTALPSPAFIPLTSIDWGKFVQVTILGLRLSLPLPACPGWDDTFARQQLRFSAFLERFTQGDGRETGARRAT
ncbi:hypothetical protein ACRALDRAFT_1079863 [Sodiomyces alcalophilus JCM 7366]|uniref:uncharacterized protein n=1 Tax=Sodiomyces alcalophilus JCM 7366 TaxID=591952 RepID=UPI0039B3BC8E